MLENTGKAIPEESPLDVYVAGLDDAGRKAAFALADKLRQNGISADTDHASRSVKAQFKYAGKIGAKFVIVIGSNELESGEYTVKNMSDSTSVNVKEADVIAFLEQNRK